MKSEPRVGGRRLYRALLRLLPGDLRRRFGHDMAELFARRLDRARGRPARTLGVWTRGVWDVVVQAVAIRWDEFDSGRWAMGAMMTDLGSAMRSLRTAPGFTLAALATLALGIGASTATFSVVHAVLLEELPYDEPERLVFVWPEVNANKAMALMAEERMPSLERVSGLSMWTLTLTGVGEPLELDGLLVAPDYFEMLGVEPALGRGFDTDADLPGQAGVVVLSHDLWVRVFGADPDVVGRTIDLGGAEYDARRVIGVMPPGVDELWRDADVWIPLEGDPALGLADDDSWYVNERLARLAAGATLEQAALEVAAYARDVHEALPGHFDEGDVTAASVQPLRAYLTRDVRSAIWFALAAVGLVLLIACFNVANLLLARGERRGHDLAVRAALGAGRERLTRMLLAEAILLGLAGGLGGVALARLLVGIVAARSPETLPGIARVAVNPSVLAFAVAATVVSVVVAGLAPALRVGSVEATAALGGAARGHAGRRIGRLTPMLVAGQVALAVVVTVASGLMIRSLTTLLAVDPGIRGDDVLVFKANPPAGRYPDGLAFQDYYRRINEQVAAIPGVEAVGGINLIPGRANNWSFPTHPEGFVVPAGSPVPSVNFRAVRGDYFGVTGMRVLRGRALGDRDREDTEPVVVVNERFVTDFWPGEDPLGRTLSIFSSSGTRYRVVGVVGDVHQHGNAIQPQPEMYFSHAQVPWNQMSMWTMARVGSGDPEVLAGSVRQAVWSVDSDVPITGMDRLADVLVESTQTTRFLTWLLSSFGLLALLLCAVGVFGVTAYTSGRRRAEFGVRIALGSSRSGVIRESIVRSFAPVAVGLGVGVAAAATSSGVLTSVLYGIEARDTATFVTVAAVMALTGIVAAAVPAWRASRVDPVTVLGSD